MKYHPVRDPAYFMSRDYTGPRWNKKFIRAVQAVMNSTKGKIGRGVSFFEAAFGRDIEAFHDILYMPETFIIYREKYMHNLAEQWRAEIHALEGESLTEAKTIIERNIFTEEEISRASSSEISHLLSYYLIERD